MSRAAHRPLRVTIVGSSPPDRGVTPYVLSLAGALDARSDVDVELLSFSAMYPPRLYPGGSGDDATEVPAGLRIRRTLAWWNPLSWLAAGASLHGDVVHAQWWSFFLAPAYAAVLAVARLRGKRVVITVHNADPHERGGVRRFADRIVLPWAHRIVVHAEQNRTTLISRGITASKIDVIPMGVRSLAEGTPASAEARAMLGIPPASPTLLFFGNIRPYKGVDVLMDAFESLVQDLPDARLIIAGQPWRDAPGIARRIAASPSASSIVSRLEFVPEDEAPAYYAAADVVVYPYRHFDAQSAAACDALRFGRAIVVSETGGLPDLVDDPAAVVPPGDPRALAAALLRVLTDGALRARLEAGARRRSAELSWDRVAAVTHALYARVAVAPRRVFRFATRG